MTGHALQVMFYKLCLKYNNGSWFPLKFPHCSTAQCGHFVFILLFQAADARKRQELVDFAEALKQIAYDTETQDLAQQYKLYKDTVTRSVRGVHK